MSDNLDFTSEARLWATRRTAETRLVEEVLRQHFTWADAYRYNNAVIRVRVIHAGFAGLKSGQRIRAVETYLDGLPEEIQGDIISLLTLEPKQIQFPPDDPARPDYDFLHPEDGLCADPPRENP